MFLAVRPARRRRSRPGSGTVGASFSLRASGQGPVDAARRPRRVIVERPAAEPARDEAAPAQATSVPAAQKARRHHGT